MIIPLLSAALFLLDGALFTRRGAWQFASGGIKIAQVLSHQVESADHPAKPDYLAKSGTAARSQANPHSVDVLERVGLYRRRRGLTPLRFEELEAVATDLSAFGCDPVSYVCDLFDKHQVVFVGHHIPTLRTGLFLQELVRALPSKGVHHVAMEYLCSDDQQLLDATTGTAITAGTAGGGAFAEELTQQAMLRWGLRHGFAFREYLDVLRAVWEMNRSAEPGEPGEPGELSDPASASRPAQPNNQMRVLALDYHLDFGAVTDTADLRSSGPWAHLRHRGTAARHMFETLQSEVVEKGHKALVLCRTAHALTRHRRRPHRRWDAFDAEINADLVVGAANHLYAAIADRAATVLIHQSLPADGILCEYALPADGMLDAIFAMIDAPATPLGFDTDVGAISTLRTRSGLDAGPLSDLAQGWVYLEAEQQRVAPTPLYGAVSDSLLKRARRFALDGELRKPEASSADFDKAFADTAISAELSWTQIL